MVLTAMAAALVAALTRAGKRPRRFRPPCMQAEKHRTTPPATFLRRAVTPCLWLLLSALVLAMIPLAVRATAGHSATEDVRAPPLVTSGELPRPAGRLSLPDVEAATGRLFEYHITAVPRSSAVEALAVVEAGEETLPTWLHLDPSTHRLTGVPDTQDIGEYYLNVTAAVVATAVVGTAPRSVKMMDVFMITVTAPRASSSVQRGSVNMCLTFHAHVVVDVPLSHLRPVHKAAVLVDVARAGGQAPQAWQLLSVSAVKRPATAYRAGWYAASCSLVYRARRDSW